MFTFTCYFVDYEGNQKFLPDITLPFLPRKGDMIYISEEWEDMTVSHMFYDMTDNTYGLAFK